MLQHPALKYFRMDGPGQPHVWCEGCGIGIVWHYTVKAMEEAGLDPDQVVWVGGSGCTGRMCTYWAHDYMHTLHGRPLGFATGIKLARPELTVVCHMGDGECSAIGGNHLIQTARRNADVLAVCVNNFNYGMTGGQFSPTTPLAAVTSTSRQGMVENAFDLCELVTAAGATYVARWTAAHPAQAVRSLRKGMLKKGFAFVEIISQCPIHYGRANRLGDGPAMMHWMRANSVSQRDAQGMSPAELESKLVVGEFVDREKPEYVATMHAIAQAARGPASV